MVSARRVAAALAAGAAALMVAAALQAQGPKFFRDDPLQREPETQDASKTADWDIPLTPDLLENMDEQIRAAVKAGGFTDPAAEELLASVLMKRRDKIGSVYFARINPLTRFTLSESGELRFENPAVRTDVSTAPAKGYEAVWSGFDNATHKAHQIGTSSAREERMQAPAELPRDAQFIKISIRAIDPPHAPWAVPVDVYFRRDAGTWTLVGVERLSQ